MSKNLKNKNAEVVASKKRTTTSKSKEPADGSIQEPAGNKNLIPTVASFATRIDFISKEDYLIQVLFILF